MYISMDNKILIFWMKRYIYIYIYISYAGLFHEIKSCVYDIATCSAEVDKSVKNLKVSFMLLMTQKLKLIIDHKRIRLTNHERNKRLRNSISKGTKGKNKFRYIFSRQRGTIEISSKQQRYNYMTFRFDSTYEITSIRGS